ncbi:MAG: type II toxin-antitoxin system Phd/YefM family antitoxin [Thermoanaerobaculia bacterium]
MRNTYSLYEAKAKLSAIVRMVREGNTIVVTLHGKPVVEMRPVGTHGVGLKGRLEDLKSRGVLVPAAPVPKGRRTVSRRPGALRRFLENRD